MDTDKQKTIVFMGVFGFLGTAIMTLRLLMRKIRGQKFNGSDYLTMVAIVCLMARIAFTTVVVLWGNNNITMEYRESYLLEAKDVYQREVGSKLTIVNRITYNTYIWIQKAVVLLLYHQFLSGLPWPRKIMKIYWVLLLLTYLVSQVVTFVECQPLNLYWQVVPDPGECTRAPIQLMIFVSLNITTDIMLIVLPMPWLMRMKRSIKERLQLVSLFSIGFLVIAIAFVRLPSNGDHGTTQINRNVWGSVEAFAAALVANIPTLFALRRRHDTRHSDQTSSCMQNDVRLPGLKQVEEESIFVRQSTELEDKLITTSSELSSLEYSKTKEKRDSQDDAMFISRI